MLVLTVLLYPSCLSTNHKKVIDYIYSIDSEVLFNIVICVLCKYLLNAIDPDGCSTHTDSLSRIVAVYNYGNLNAHNIFKGLKEGETIKIITHSMGSACWKWFISNVL